MRDRNDVRVTADQLLQAALAAPTKPEREWLIGEAVRLHAEAAETFEAHLRAEASREPGHHVSRSFAVAELGH